MDSDNRFFSVPLINSWTDAVGKDWLLSPSAGGTLRKEMLECQGYDPLVVHEPQTPFTSPYQVGYVTQAPSLRLTSKPSPSPPRAFFGFAPDTSPQDYLSVRPFTQSLYPAMSPALGELSFSATYPETYF